MGWSDPAWLTLAGIIIHNLHNGDTHTHTLHLFRQSCPLRMQQPPLRHTSLSHQLYATEYSRNGLRAILRNLGPSHRNRHSYASSASRFLPFAHGPWNSLSPIPGGFRAFPLPLSPEPMLLHGEFISGVVMDSHALAGGRGYFLRT